MPFPSMHSVANGKGFLELAEEVGGREKYPVEVRVGLTLVPPMPSSCLRPLSSKSNSQQEFEGARKDSLWGTE